MQAYQTNNEKYQHPSIARSLLLLDLFFFSSRRRHTRCDRKSTRLNSSHGYISYAVFCLKKKKVERADGQLDLPRDHNAQHHIRANVRAPHAGKDPRVYPKDALARLTLRCRG